MHKGFKGQPNYQNSGEYAHLQNKRTRIHVFDCSVSQQVTNFILKMGLLEEAKSGPLWPMEEHDPLR